MALTRVVSSEPLRDDEATSWAPAVSRRLATSLAGRGRYLLELLRGDNCGFEGDAGTPLNPQGLIGVDRSGPPWGDAHQHPLWYYEYKKTSNAIKGGMPIATLTSTGRDHVELYAYFVVRPFFQFDKAPYSRAYLAWRITQTGTVGASATAVARVYAFGSFTQDTPSSTLTTTTTATSTSTAFGYTRPGLNILRIVVEATSFGAGAEISVESMSLVQIARRSH